MTLISLFIQPLFYKDALFKFKFFSKNLQAL